MLFPAVVVRRKIRIQGNLVQWNIEEIVLFSEHAYQLASYSIRKYESVIVQSDFLTDALNFVSSIKSRIHVCASTFPVIEHLRSDVPAADVIPAIALAEKFHPALTAYLPDEV